MSSIVFDHKGIGKLISNGRLKVPINQREYSWEDQHVEELCTDFYDAIRENNDSYFLGTIVLTQSSDGTFEVVDGQQRLATAIMFLAAIRDISYQDKEDKFVQSIEQEFLYRIDRKTEELTPNLILNVKDHEFYSKRILLQPDDSKRIQLPAVVTPSNKKIEKASQFIRGFIEDLVRPITGKSSSKKDLLNQWVTFIENHAKVIILGVPDNENAYIMFETLNDRGLKVSQGDLVKNYLFGNSGDRLREVQDKWASMISTLEAIGADDLTIDFLRSFCSLLYGLTREREVFKRIKKYVYSQHETIEFVDNLDIFASDYIAMLSPDHLKWNNYPSNIRRSLRTLAQFEVTQIRHLMLAVAHHFSKEEAAKSFNLFVNWIVRFFIAGSGRIGRVELNYANLAHSIHEGKIKRTKELADQMNAYLATDDEFKQAFEIAKVSRTKLARYYLDALERQNRGKKHPELVPNDDSTVVNLEHVLPQNHNDSWPEIESDIAEALCNRIGNLVLLDAKTNSRIGNSSFKDKREAFKKSSFSLTKSVSEYDKWGTEEINKHQKILADITVKTWSIKVQ